MSWKILKEPKLRHAGGERSFEDNQIRLSTQQRGGKSSPDVDLALRIGVKVLRKLKWTIGDRILPVADGEVVGFIRSNAGGATLACLSGVAKGHHGEVLPALAKFNLPIATLEKYIGNGEPRLITDPLIDAESNVLIIGDRLYKDAGNSRIENTQTKPAIYGRVH